MDEEVSISQLAELDTSALIATEKLVTCLRGCMLFATTPEASRVRLGGSRVGFASEMILISNKGIDTLVKIATYLHSMKLTAESMVKEGGTFERLQSDMGTPAERESHDRLMRRLEEEVRTCNAGGADVYHKITSWQAEIEKFQGMVTKSNETYEKQSEAKDFEIGRLNAEIDWKIALLRQGENEGGEAKFRYDESRRDQKRLVNQHYSTRVGPKKAGILEMAGTMVRLKFESYIFAQDVKKTQEELERRRRETKDYEIQIADAEIELQKLTSQSKELGNFTNALRPTLKAFVYLTNNMTSLVMGFAKIQPLLDRFSTRHAETRSMWENNLDDPASLEAIQDFAKDAKEMSAWVLELEYRAWLYASIIEKVLIGDLNSVQDVDDSGGDGVVETLNFFQAAQRQPKYLEGNQSTCNKISRQANAKYNQEKLAMTKGYESVIESLEAERKGRANEERSRQEEEEALLNAETARLEAERVRREKEKIAIHEVEQARLKAETAILEAEIAELARKQAKIEKSANKKGSRKLKLFSRR